ncbi:MAG: aminotransferase class I/II-fold pyridoxal phosphate-dependent enzyme [Candidatus Micrarchaeia archaeon]
MSEKNPSKFVSKKAESLAPSGIRKFFDIASKTKNLISLGVGEPDFPTPWNVRETAIYELERGHTHYTSNQGSPRLRSEISKSLNKKYNVEYDAEKEVLVTSGVSEGLDVALRAITNPKETVVVVEPSYVAYTPCAILAGANALSFPTKLENEFKINADELEKTAKNSKALIINYPNNPTGAVMTKNELEKVAKVAVEHDLLVISDEIYADLTYDGLKHCCFSSLNGMKERTILLSGFSKAFAMTGWRIGYACAPEEITSTMTKIHQYSMLCAPTVAQNAAITALRECEEEVKKNVAEYNRRRRLLVKGLNDAGLECFEPKGAFYAFPSIQNTGMTDEQFSEKLLKEKKVAAVPGSAFGESGKGFIRCTYATSTEKIKEATEKIKEFTTKL